MDRVNCKYHPETPARWSCAACGIDLCPSCTKVEHLPHPTAVCPVCTQVLTALGAGNAITPFWLRIPRFFAYPFKPTPLLYIGALSVAGTVLAGSTLMGALLGLAVFVVFLRYAYAVLEHTAQGQLDPPAVGLSMINEGMELPFKQLGVILAFGFLQSAVYESLGLAVAIAFGVLTNLCLPATTMVLAIESSFLRALNPLVLLGIVRRIGMPYLILWVFLMILSGSAGAFFGVFGAPRSFAAFLFVFYFVSMYFLLVMFHMMGYVIFQYHEELGFNVEVEPEEGGAPAPTARNTVPAHPALTEAEILVKEGKPAVAIERLVAALAAAPQELALRERLHRLALLTGDQRRLLDHAPALIRELLRLGKARRAAEVTADCLRSEPAFRPDTPEAIHPLAEELLAMQQHLAVLQLTNGFARRHGQHADIPRLYFLAARALSEGLRQDQKAEAVLTDLLRHYPDHALVPKIRTYLETVRKLTARAAAAKPAG